MKKNEPIVTQTTLLLKDILNGFLLHPDQCKVSGTCLTASASVRIECAPEDIRRVIGPEGSHFKALAWMVERIGSVAGYDMLLFKLKDPVNGVKSDRYQHGHPAQSWNSQAVQKMIADTSRLIFREPKAVCLHVAQDDEEALIVEVFVAPDELLRVIDGAKAMMRILFNAIGQTVGRNVLVDIAPANRKGRAA